jgi:lipoprotein-releasing system permease protein
MPFEIFLAFRYLRSRRRKRMARVTALLAMVGIAFGVSALIVALALANGFRDELRDKILRGTAHITVLRADGQPMPNYREISERISKVEGVVTAAPTTYEGAVLNGQKASAYAVLRGLDRESQTSKFELQRSLIEGTSDSLFASTLSETNEPRLPNVIVGSELARRTGLHVGDAAEIIPAGASLAAGKPIVRHVQVAGIFRSGLFEYDSTWILLSFERAAAYAGASQSATVLSVEVRDIYVVKRIARDLRDALGKDYTTIDWEEANQPLFTALALERRVGLLIIGLVVLLAALNITSTLILVVVERRSDIAILRSLGARAISIMGIFMIEGAVIGLLGAALGMGLGKVVCVAGNHYNLVRLPADVYSISSVPFNTHPRDLILAGLIAFLLSLLATIYPAQAAARVRPIELLKEAK